MNVRPLAWRARITGEATVALARASGAPGTLEAACFEAHPDAQLVFDADCAIVATNRAAHELIEDANGPRALAENLVASGSAALREVRAGILRAIREQRASEPIELRVSPTTSFVLSIVPLGPALERALMIVKPRESSCAQTARERFGLTPAESHVAERIARGMTVARIAEQLGISVETVRCHLKQAFVKAGVHRQAELVAVLLGR